MAICWVPRNDWPKHIARIKSLLKPGGWAELQDLSVYSFFLGDDPEPISNNWEWTQVLKEDVLGSIDASCGIHLETNMKNSGLTEIKTAVFPFPAGNALPGRPETQPLADHYGKIGPLVSLALLDKNATEKYGAEKVQELKEAAMEQGFSGKIQGLHQRFYVCIGRKPDSLSEA